MRFHEIRARLSQALAILFSVLGGPAIALIWDPPIRILDWMVGASQS